MNYHITKRIVPDWIVDDFSDEFQAYYFDLMIVSTNDALVPLKIENDRCAYYLGCDGFWKKDLTFPYDAYDNYVNTKILADVLSE